MQVDGGYREGVELIYAIDAAIREKVAAALREVLS